MMADNYIGDEGAAALAPSLRGLTRLTTLNIYSEFSVRVRDTVRVRARNRRWT